MKVLVTGHTGFKGAWLVALLKNLGHEVIGISDFADKESLYEKASLFKDLLLDERLDMRDYGKLVHFLSQYEFDVVFHLAAQALVRKGYRDPLETFETNVLGTVNLLNGLKNTHYPKVCVVVTSDKVYKENLDTPGYIESDELGGRDPYSASKSAADILTQSWSASFKEFPIAIVRAGNVIGGGDRGLERLIPDIVKSFSDGIPVTIRNPTAIRPWQHVLDCLRGYLMVMEYTLRFGESDAWNFGPLPQARKTVREVAEFGRSFWGASAALEFDKTSQLYESDKLVINSEKARSKLGWSELLSFESSLIWTFDYYMRSENGEDPRSLLECQIKKYIELSGLN